MDSTVVTIALEEWIRFHKRSIVTACIVATTVVEEIESSRRNILPGDEGAFYREVHGRMNTTVSGLMELLVNLAEIPREEIAQTWNEVWDAQVEGIQNARRGVVPVTVFFSQN